MRAPKGRTLSCCSRTQHGPGRESCWADFGCLLWQPGQWPFSSLLSSWRSVKATSIPAPCWASYCLLVSALSPLPSPNEAAVSTPGGTEVADGCGLSFSLSGQYFSRKHSGIKLRHWGSKEGFEGVGHFPVLQIWLGLC